MSPDLHPEDLGPMEKIKNTWPFNSEIPDLHKPLLRPTLQILKHSFVVPFSIISSSLW